MGKIFFIGTILIVAAVGFSPVAAQQPAAEPIPAADRVPFAALHAELNRAADNALSDAVQRMTEAASDQRRVEWRAPESLVSDFDQQYRPAASNKLETAITRLARLRPVLQPILQREGIPLELASVALVESGGRTDVLSRKGALGLWQLMPDTARHYGLVVNSAQDQRLDPERSTYAAAHYLADLYEQFGSWPLALAAYNAGEGSVRRAMARAGSSDFLTLSSLRLLPQETRDYVPAVLAAMQLIGASEVPRAPRRMSVRSDKAVVFAVSRPQP